METLNKPVRPRSLPKSLRGQFWAAFFLLALLMVAAAVVSVYELQSTASSVATLGAARLEQLERAEALSRLTEALVADTAQVLADAEDQDLTPRYRRIVGMLDQVDTLTLQFAADPNGGDVLDLYSASQKLRASVNIVIQLRDVRGEKRRELRAAIDDALRSAQQIHANAALGPLAAVALADSQSQLQELHMRYQALASMASTAAGHIARQRAEQVFELASQRLNRNSVRGSFSLAMEQNGGQLAKAALDRVAYYKTAYRQHLDEVLAHATLGSSWVVGLAALCVGAYLILTLWLVGHHVIGRLVEVSKRLRSNPMDAGSTTVAVYGSDEISAMARSVERFLAERKQLAITRMALDEERGYLHELIQQSADGILVVDGDGYCHDVNDAVLRLIGVDAPTLRRQPVSNFLPAAARQRQLRLLARYLRRKPLRTGRLLLALIRADASRVMVEASVSAISTQGRTLAVIMLRDITERLEQARYLTAARDSAEATLRAQTAFLANMSHEIRTPMNAVIGFTELLQRGTLDVGQADYLRRVQNASRHLLGILNDVLDFSKIEAGKMQTENVGFALADLLDQCSGVYSAAARGKGLYLRTEYQGGPGLLLRGDPLRLTQVLSNLLANAIKFTQHGGVTLAAEVLDDGDPLTLCLTVRDTGVGMAEEHMRNLFQPFVQADASTTRHFGGTGLGLAISSGLVRLMGGSFQVRSEPGQGSVFSFQLTLARALVDEVSIQRAVDTNQAACRDLKVLLTEDNADNQLVGKELLRRAGVEVTLANNGAEALAMLQTADFDLVLMDIHMPEMDGFEATRRLRAMPQFAHLPVIAMTAAATVQDRNKCLEAGMNDHIGKPFDLGQLLDTIARWSGRQVQPAEARSAMVEHAKVQVADVAQNFIPAALPGVDCASAIGKLFGRQDMYQRLVGMFLSNYADAPALFSGYADVASQELRLLRAHSLISSAAMLGAWPLSAAARAYEQVLTESAAHAQMPELAAELERELLQVLASLRQLPSV